MASVIEVREYTLLLIPSDKTYTNSFSFRGRIKPGMKKASHRRDLPYARTDLRDWAQELRYGLCCLGLCLCMPVTITGGRQGHRGPQRRTETGGTLCP